MKRSMIWILVIAMLLLSLGCAQKAPTAAVAAAAEAPAVPAATEAPAAPAEEPTAAPTAEPTPAPTATPVPETVTALGDVEISRRDGVVLTAKSLTVAPGTGMTFLLGVENTSQKAVEITLTSLVLNGWQIVPEFIAMEPVTVAPGAASEAVIALTGTDAPRFADMRIDAVATADCKFAVKTAGTTGEPAVHACTIAVPGADGADAFSVAGTVLLDERSMRVILQSADETMEHVMLYVEKTDAANFATCCFAPICNGYTDHFNEVTTQEKGTRMLVLLDNTALFERYGITSLGTMDIYLTKETGERIYNAIQLTATNPLGGETVAATAADESPVVYEDQYAVIRNLGVDKTLYADHPAILLDLENITQTYIKTMEITAFPSHGTIELDGVAYTLGLHCTYSYPRTHGFVMVWPTDAPEGALENASEAKIRLKLARFRSGHLDPVSDTGWITIDLK